MDNACREITYDEIPLGEAASFTVTIDAPLVEDFSRFSGDKNPLHMDEAYARTATPAGQRIAHGMIIGALFSRLIGMHVPGKYALYLSQTLQFKNPILLGTEIVIKGEVIHKTDAHRTITVRTTAEEAATGKPLVSGEAMVQLLK